MTRRVVENLCPKKVCIDIVAPIEGLSQGWDGGGARAHQVGFPLEILAWTLLEDWFFFWTRPRQGTEICNFGKFSPLSLNVPHR